MKRFVRRCCSSTRLLCDQVLSNYYHRPQSIYNIVGVHENGEAEGSKPETRRGRRVELEGPRRVGFLGGNVSLPAS